MSSYFWTIEDFVQGELLPFVFADAEDERQQYTMVIHQVMRRLADGEAVGDDGQWKVDGVTLRTYHDLVELVVDRLNDDDDRGRLGRTRDRLGHDQRVHPPAAVVPARRSAR